MPGRKPLPRRRRRCVLGLLAAVIGLLVMVPAHSASAHAYLNESNPADGAVLSATPTQLRLSFSESVLLGATSIDLVDGDDARLNPQHLRLVTSSPAAGIEGPVTVLADLPALSPNTYRLSWRTLSRDDLHRTSGVIVFGIGRQVTAAGSTEPAPRGFEAVLRWLLLAGFAAAIGGLLAHRLYRRAGGPAQARHAASLATLGSLVGAVAAVVLLLLQVRASGATLAEALSGRFGLGWWCREAGLLVLAGIAALPGAWRPAARIRAVMITAAVAAAGAGGALTGHSGGGGLTRIAADAAHLVAAACWFGGLACLVVAGLGRSGRRAAGPVLRRAFVAFGRPAAVSLAVLVSTGVYLLSGVVASVDAGLRTNYGRVLLLKLVLVAVALLAGLINHRRLRRGDRATNRRRTLAAEAMVGLAVLGLAAILTSSQPALEARFVAVPAATTPTLDTVAGDLQQTVAVRPNQPGRNLAVLQVLNTRRPAPAPIGAVQVQLRTADGRLGAPSAAQQLPDGGWSAPLDLTASGRVQLDVTVRRAGMPDAHSSFRWSVSRSVSPGGHTVLVSDRPLRAWAQAAGSTLMMMTLLGVSVLGWRSRRRASSRGNNRTPASGSDEVHPDPDADRHPKTVERLATPRESARAGAD